MDALYRLAHRNERETPPRTQSRGILGFCASAASGAARRPPAITARNRRRPSESGPIPAGSGMVPPCTNRGESSRGGRDRTQKVGATFPRCKGTTLIDRRQSAGAGVGATSGDAPSPGRDPCAGVLDHASLEQLVSV